MNQYTSLNEAFYYKPNPELYPPTSPNCIYCNTHDTQLLLQDGSFRQCNNRSCRKQFRPQPICKPVFKPCTINQQKHVNDFIMTNYPILMNQKQNPQFNPQTAQYNGPFSHPQFDKQLKK